MSVIGTTTFETAPASICAATAAEIAAKRGLESTWTDLLNQSAVQMDESLTNALAAAAPMACAAYGEWCWP